MLTIQLLCWPKPESSCAPPEPSTTGPEEVVRPPQKPLPHDDDVLVAEPADVTWGSAVLPKPSKDTSDDSAWKRVQKKLDSNENGHGRYDQGADHHNDMGTPKTIRYAKGLARASGRHSKRSSREIPPKTVEKPNCSQSLAWEVPRCVIVVEVVRLVAVVAS